MKTPPPIARTLLLLVLLLAAAGARAADARVAVITLHYAEPAAVVAALQDTVGKGGSVHAVGDRLVISADPDRLAEIRRVVADLDRVPRTLLISVRTSAERSHSREHGGVSGQWGNDSTRIVVNRGDNTETETHTRITLGRRDSAGNDSGSRTITTLEGHDAHIAIGNAFPEDSYSIGPYGETRIQRDYVPVERGFTVNARVHDGRAVVRLHYSDDRHSRDGTIRSEAAATRFSAPLGQWFAVGSVEEHGTRNENVILGHGTDATAHSNRVWLKVELAK